MAHRKARLTKPLGARGGQFFGGSFGALGLLIRPIRCEPSRVGWTFAITHEHHGQPRPKRSPRQKRCHGHGAILAVYALPRIFAN